MVARRGPNLRLVVAAVLLGTATVAIVLVRRHRGGDAHGRALPAARTQQVSTILRNGVTYVSREADAVAVSVDDGDPRQLNLFVVDNSRVTGGSMCRGRYPQATVARADSRTVTLTVVNYFRESQLSHGRRFYACGDPTKNVGRVSVHLPAPLGDRVVRDAVTGGEIRRVDRRDLCRALRLCFSAH